MQARIINTVQLTAVAVSCLMIDGVRLIVPPRHYNTYATDYFAQLYTKD
ncbi:hypothetical protein [Allopusillimonas soli]|uniref:Uncharacterized protein n=1 Tax=Allopusillimonas soli TaxID=659016 RepID=A0A853FDC6_9BURK|nr:hypothetical protein [Allopusillimonas soli]NYT38864.1 hypothetical protein [Allopusillimonas soli]